MEIKVMITCIAPTIWIGIDAGKEFHWAHAFRDSGTQLLSRRVENNEANLLRLTDAALSLAGQSRAV